MWILNKIPNKIIVNCDRKPYLRRWYLIHWKFFSLFLHRFFRSDEERALHDHPWSFITFILWRGYIEHQEKSHPCPICNSRYQTVPSHKCPNCHGSKFFTIQSTHRRWPLTIHYRPATHRHRVELVDGKPAWTLIIHFKRIREWGFWEKTGFVQWNKWWQNNCE